MNKINQKGFSHWVLPIVVLAIIAGVGLSVFSTLKEKTGLGIKIDVNNPAKFIQHDFIDLSKIYTVSKFRSGDGHDFSGNGETCRSMKHYFTPQEDPSIKPTRVIEGHTVPPDPDGKHDIDIYSPVDGTITDIAQERLPVGEQIYIEPSSAKDYTIRLFHIYKIDGIKKGSNVKAGQKIGVISGYSATDISVEGGRDQYVSYFQVMPDSVFAEYQKRGAKSRDDFIISRDYRDAHAIPCNQDVKGDQAFQYPENYDHEADSFRLSGYVKPDYSKQQQGQHNCGNSCGNGNNNCGNTCGMQNGNSNNQSSQNNQNTQNTTSTN